MNGTTLAGMKLPNHPHNVEPKLVRLPAVGLVVLSSGRCGQYVWWAKESDVLAFKQGPLWHSIDIRARHNAALPEHPAWHFAGTCSESTAYTSVSVLGDPSRATEIVVVYDKTHIEVPKTLPKGDEVNYIFSVKLTFRSAAAAAVDLPLSEPGPGSATVPGCCDASTFRDNVIVGGESFGPIVAAKTPEDCCTRCYKNTACECCECNVAHLSTPRKA
jgi:hypothetical protein